MIMLSRLLTMFGQRGECVGNYVFLFSYCVTTHYVISIVIT